MYNVISEINKLEEKYGEEFNWGTDLKPEYFETELKRETTIAPFKSVKAIARSYSNDDVLFVLDDEVYRIYHLTYSGGNPRYQEFTDGQAAVDYIEKRFLNEYL
ncbi:hypothetical protein SAMN02745229_00356 [Butyrivibrio fibrisolvens DSM 3071]|uniref:Uncharacterized protein n=1 Tax=Butyrivibrio fibrisolvens DSM 3071 TaxID=1121131 RepID=A0A1M5QL89_BUTFI|nr:hypothetical protein [Butyrivibrio fibrisolvens]SHH14857.1 hypothetical protein SAMN02745229_00356 [Butyrivibrio fibrisolvens DSM 3071]